MRRSSMSSRAVYGFIAATCLSSVVAVGAQSQATPPSPAAGAQSADSPVVTVIGCVLKENAVLKKGPAAGDVGMGDEFVLTNSKLSPGDKSTDPAPPAATPPAGDPVGTSGSASNFGKVYRVTGDKEKDLQTYVGQRVEISGAFKNASDAKTELSAGRSPAGELTTQNTPEITIASVKVSSGSCPSGK
jgi:hypothetical protein